MEFETVYTALSAADAQLVCSRLKAAGIEAQVSDEIAAMSMEGYSLAAGGIRIRVPKAEAVMARELIEDLEKSEDESS